jgi:hypothetical protein
MAKLNGELVYRGKLGGQLRHHHPRHGKFDTFRMWGGIGGADVIYVDHPRWRLVLNPIARRQLAREAVIRRPRKNQIVSLQLLNFERSA